MTNRDRLIEKGWKQGAILRPASEITAGANYDVDDSCLLLVLTQTCDLVHESFDMEPYFEVLCLKPLDKGPDGNYAHGKNSRRLEFIYSIEGIKTNCWSSNAHQRHVIDRKLLLENLEPEYFIADTDLLQIVLKWIAKRYTRIAFPETFVARFVTLRKVENQFKRAASLVSNIYIRLLPSFEELKPDIPYGLDLILLLRSENFDNPRFYDETVEISRDIERLLNKCEGLYVEEIEVMSTAEAPVGLINNYLAWDYSYLSNRSDDAALPIDV